MSPKAFEALSTPINQPGFHLLEAGAGSGKTHSITFIVLRLIAEHDVDLKRLLISTYTKAAASELKTRVLTLMREAEECLKTSSESDDSTPLNQWVKQQSNPKKARQRIRQAIVQFDQIAIGTIDSICQSLLRRYALDTMSDLIASEQVDESKIFNQLLETFWIETLNSVPLSYKPLWLSRFPKPGGTSGLGKRVRSDMMRGTVVTEFVSDPFDFGHEATLINLEFPEHFYKQWQIWKAEGKVDSRKINKAERIWSALKFQTEKHLPSSKELMSGDLLTYLISTTNKTGKKEAEAYRLDEHDALFFEQVALYQSWLLSFENRFCYHAVSCLQQRLVAYFEQHEQFSYDSIRTALDTHLKSNPSSPLQNGFDALVIDEFQDTDRTQWHIFQCLKSESGAGYLIGDPKQAIYQFRKADLNTYFQAASSCTNHYYLPNNWRSAPEVVNAQNQLFSLPNAFLDERLHFNPANAARTGLKGQAYWVPVLNESDQWDSSQTDATTFQVIQHVLTQGYQPGEVMVLVKTHQQAADIHALLARADVPASRSKLVGTESLINCIITWLKALENPFSESQQKALRLAVLREDLTAVVAQHDSHYWLQLIQQWQNRWIYLGPLGLWELMRNTTVLNERWGAQHRQADLEAMPLLLQSLQNYWQIQPKFEQRLPIIERWRQEQNLVEESMVKQDNAVQLHTLHGSKGLESRVVICAYLEPKSKAKVTYLHSLKKGGYAVKYTENDVPAPSEMAVEERRLLYVALTRGIESMYWIEHGGDSFLSTLLNLPTNYLKSDFEMAMEKLSAWQCFVPKVSDTPFQHSSTETTTEHKRNDLRLYKPSQGVMSFSRMIAGGHERSSDLVSYDEAEAVQLAPVTESEPSLKSGAAAGNALHEAFEWLLNVPEQRSMFLTDPRSAIMRSKLLSFLNRNGLSETSLEDFTAYLQRTLLKPLPSISGRSLNDFSTSELRCEMRFDMHLSSLDIRRLNKAAQPFSEAWHLSTLPDRPLLHQTIFSGFIDVTLQDDQRYWVLDFKSNQLTDYQQQHLAESMRSHFYGWQASFYLLALHRYLQRTLKNYQIERHLGSACYLYVRGIDSAGEAGICQLPASNEWINCIDQLLKKESG